MNKFAPVNSFIAGKVVGEIGLPKLSRKYAELLTTIRLIEKNNEKITGGQKAIAKLESGSNAAASKGKISKKQGKVHSLLENGLALNDKFNELLRDVGKILSELPAAASWHVNKAQYMPSTKALEMQRKLRALSFPETNSTIRTLSGAVAIIEVALFVVTPSVLLGALSAVSAAVYAFARSMPYAASKANDIHKVNIFLETIIPPERLAEACRTPSATIPRELKDDVEDMLFAISQKTVPEGARGMFRALLGQHIYANANFKGFEFQKGSVDKSNSEVYFRMTRIELAEFIRAKVPKVGFDLMVSEVGRFTVPKKTLNPFATHFRAKRTEAAKVALEMLADLSSAAYDKQ
ncbi:MAG: hypothetical protein WCT52_03700 [Candidatus Micrarchaeia archaeon]